MKNKTAKQKRLSPKRVLRLPDLDYAKAAVLNTLSSSDSRRSYRFAIDDFVTWYCSEPRLAFSKTIVLRYRLELEGRHLAPSTINLRLAAKICPGRMFAVALDIVPCLRSANSRLRQNHC